MPAIVLTSRCDAGVLVSRNSMLLRRIRQRSVPTRAVVAMRILSRLNRTCAERVARRNSPPVSGLRARFALAAGPVPSILHITRPGIFRRLRIRTQRPGQAVRTAPFELFGRDALLDPLLDGA